MASETAITASGRSTACHGRSRAPPNTPRPPTGVKLYGCGSTRQPTAKAAVIRAIQPGCRRIQGLLAHLAQRLPQQHEVRLGGADLIEQAALGPVVAADLAPAAQRMAQQHQADQGHALEARAQGEAVRDGPLQVRIEVV